MTTAARGPGSASTTARASDAPGGWWSTRTGSPHYTGVGLFWDRTGLPACPPPPLDILGKRRYSSPRMSTPDEKERIEFLQGTLDMLVLRTLLLGPAHGHAIAHAIERNSDDVLQVEQGSLYPALHRLIERGWI